MDKMFYLTMILFAIIIYLIIDRIFRYLETKSYNDCINITNNDVDVNDLIDTGIEDIIINDECIEIKLLDGDNQILYTNDERIINKFKQLKDELKKGE